MPILLKALPAHVTGVRAAIGPVTQCEADYQAYKAAPAAGTYNAMHTSCTAAAGNPALGAVSAGANSYAASPAGSAGGQAASAQSSLSGLPPQAVRPSLLLCRQCRRGLSFGVDR